MTISIFGSLFVVIALISNSASSISLSINVEHDMSAPTYGLQQPTSSQLTYDPQHGLNMKGTINDILGPPIKIANGFNSMLTGSSMAGVGSSLKAGGAVLGLDAKLLEAAGGANILKGGLLLGRAAGHKAVATALAGLPGKKIASIVEVPVKVVAVKDIAAGKVLKGLGAVKGVKAAAAINEGQALMEKGGALKKTGLSQVVEGATEGMQNIGHMVQQTANNAATAFKFLPLVLESEQQQQQQAKEEATKSGADQQQHQQQQHQLQHHESSAKQAGGSGAPITGGSMFGGLASLLGGSGSSNPDPLGGLFGSGHHNNDHHGYAAVLDSASPLTNLLMNPNVNPFLYPMAGGPLGQSLASKGFGNDLMFSHQQQQPHHQQQQQYHQQHEQQQQQVQQVQVQQQQQQEAKS